ncbi:hypothetical protein [Microbacterium marmarense]|uniref:Uncharacterized protein n=1 Tax=Microbacterium marmarense TaxID=3122051 RepID=A0ABU8LTC3_9MICO
MTMTDDELLDEFERGALKSFPHREHVRVAYLLLQRDGFDEGSRNMSEGILTMAIAAGFENKFHVTRTIAWLHVVQAAMLSGGDAADSQDFVDQHPDLLDRDRLSQHYSPEALKSLAARRAFVEPDREPFQP